MGIFDRFRNKKEQTVSFVNNDFIPLSLKDEQYIPLNKHPDVVTAVNKIADLISNMTIHLMQNTDKGDVRVHNKLSRKIDVEPCRNMTRKSWLFRIVRDMLLDGNGNAVVYVSYDYENDLIKDLIPLSMQEVSYKILDNDYEIHYRKQKYSSDEVVHFVLNPDPKNYFLGTGYKVFLKNVVDNLSQATKTKKSFMTGKSTPSLIVKVDANNEELASSEGRAAIYNKYLESEEANQPWIIPADMLEVHAVKPLTLKDIAINESVEIDKKTVAGILGVPAYILGVGDFNNDEYRNFIDTRIMSIAQIIAQTLTRDLLYSESFYFRLNQRSLYAYNLNELVAAGTELVKVNALRRNELRDWLGLPPDDEMNDLIVLENYVPQDKLGDQEKLKGGETNG